MAALELYELNNKINQLINKQGKNGENSVYFIDECYLIQENWFLKYKNFYLNNEIYQSIINEKKANKNSSIILESVSKKFEDIYLGKNKDIKEIPILKENNLLKLDYKINNDDTELIFHHRYEIINKAILDNISMDKLELTNKYIPLKFCINNKKIILQYEESKLLIIGNINIDNNIKNIFIPEIILKYEKEFQINQMFITLQTKDISEFEKSLNKENENNKSVKIYEFDKIKYLNLKEDEFEEKDEKNKIILDRIQNKSKMLPEFLKNDIKFVAKYLIFYKKFSRAIYSSKNEKNYQYYPNCYLINSNWISIFKFYFFYEKLNKITNDEVKEKPLINILLDNDDECLANDLFGKIIKNFPDSYDEKGLNEINLNLENEKRFEMEYEYHFQDELEIAYPSTFEVIDISLNNSIIHRNNNELMNSNLKCEIVINEGKIIIKYDISENENNNDKNNYCCLLIGKLNLINNNFINEFLLIFTKNDKMEKRDNLFNDFQNNSFSDVIKNNEKDFHLIDFNKLENEMNEKTNNNNDEYNFDKDHIGNKIIKLFLIYFLLDEEIMETIKKNINDNGFGFYYLINKEWMKIYKEYYEYNKIYDFLNKLKKTDKNFNSVSKIIISSLKKNYSDICNNNVAQIIKNIPKDFLEMIENRKKEQANLSSKLRIDELSNFDFPIDKNTYKSNKVIYYGENEIINYKFLDLFNEIETSPLKKAFNDKVESIKCLIGENRIFILSEEYNLIDVGYIQNNLFKPTYVIYYNSLSDYSDFIINLSKTKFSEFMNKYSLLNRDYVNIYNSNNDKIGEIGNLSSNYFGKVKTFAFSVLNIKPNKIKPSAQKILKLFIYLNQFKKEMNFPSQNKEIKLGYLIKMEFIDIIRKTKLYQIIDNYIKNNNEIQKLLLNNNNDDINTLLDLITQEIDDEETLKLINLEAEDININCTSYDIKYENMVVNDNNISYINNFIIFNEDIYKVFKGFLKSNESCNYYQGDNKIFVPKNSIIQLIQKNYINVYKYSEEKGLELDLILFLEKGNNYKDIIKINGFKYIVEYLVFENDYISPIFDSNQKRIGIAFKYDSTVKNYEKMNINYINFEIRKIFLLYANYYNLKKKYSSKNNEKTFYKYYIVNKKWIKIYKDYYDWENIYNILDKNLAINKLFDRIIETNNEINDRTLTMIAKKIPIKIFETFNESDKVFQKKYKNEEKKIPSTNKIKYSNSKKIISYFHDFELISSDIYENLFLNLDKKLSDESNLILKNVLFWKKTPNETEKVECMFDEGTILIKFMNKMEDSNNKYLIYLGKLNGEYIFEPEHFLLYDNISLMNEYINQVIKEKGINNSYSLINCNVKKEIELIDNEKIYGIAVKNNK